MAPPPLTLRLTNTLGGRREPLRPLSAEAVRMYHCGPTVTGPVNIDKFRSYLLGDVLRRYLEYLGAPVRQVMNITDVGHLNEFEEDAVEIMAARSGLAAWELVEQEEKAFHDDRRYLGILDAHVYPRARDHVPEMVELVRKLLESGAAYRVGGNVYFDSRRAPSLGKLSGKSPRELEGLHLSAPRTSFAASGGKERKSPLDFDLWRSDALHQTNWQSPWGHGFPGWHVECVVMGRKYLGTPFDVHSGTEENIFPHHECEIAEAEAAGGGPLAAVWLHSGHVLLEGKPVSRQNRNLITVRGLRESGVGGLEIRAALLSSPYRERIEFRPEALEEAAAAIAELRSFREGHRSGAAKGGKPSERLEKRIDEAEHEFRAALDEDLDYARALRAARKLAADVDPGAGGPRPAAAEAIERFDRVLGLLG